MNTRAHLSFLVASCSVALGAPAADLDAVQN